MHKPKKNLKLNPLIKKYLKAKNTKERGVIAFFDLFKNHNHIDLITWQKKLNTLVFAPLALKIANCLHDFCRYVACYHKKTFVRLYCEPLEPLTYLTKKDLKKIYKLLKQQDTFLLYIFEFLVSKGLWLDNFYQNKTVFFEWLTKTQPSSFKTNKNDFLIFTNMSMPVFEQSIEILYKIDYLEKVFFEISQKCNQIFNATIMQNTLIVNLLQKGYLVDTILVSLNLTLNEMFAKIIMIDLALLKKNSYQQNLENEIQQLNFLIHTMKNKVQILIKQKVTLALENKQLKAQLLQRNNKKPTIVTPLTKDLKTEWDQKLLENKKLELINTLTKLKESLSDDTNQLKLDEKHKNPAAKEEASLEKKTNRHDKWKIN